MVDNLSATYKPEYESRALVFHLQPGTGVHSPVNTPHWLQNGNNVSVSLNINFQFHESEWENLFKANYYLRKAGFRPLLSRQAPSRGPHEKSCLFSGSDSTTEELKASQMSRLTRPAKIITELWKCWLLVDPADDRTILIWCSL